MNAAAALTICEFISFWISPLACLLLPKNVNGGIFVFLVPSQAAFELGVTRALIRFPFCNCSLTLFFFAVLSNPLIFACGWISSLQWLYCQFSALWLNYMNSAYAFFWWWYHWQYMVEGKKHFFIWHQHLYSTTCPSPQLPRAGKFLVGLSLCTCVAAQVAGGDPHSSKPGSRTSLLHSQITLLHHGIKTCVFLESYINA